MILNKIEDAPTQFIPSNPEALEFRLTVKEKIGMAYDPDLKKETPYFQGIELVYRRERGFRL